MGTHHDGPVQLLASLGVGGVEVDAVEASVDGGFPEAGDTQHGAFGGGEHDLRLPMHRALVGGEKWSGRQQAARINLSRW